jgi:hypothetical protein
MSAYEALGDLQSARVGLSRTPWLGSVSDTSVLVDRLHKLRVLLPAMGLEVAVARREVIRLQRENARLRGCLSELEQGGERTQ